MINKEEGQMPLFFFGGGGGKESLCISSICNVILRVVKDL